MCFVFDSDKDSAKSKITKTKHRIIEESKGLGELSMVWMTKGREIENYYSLSQYWPVVTSVHSRLLPKKPKCSVEYYCDYTSIRDSKGNRRDVDKVRIAKQIVEDKTIPHRQKKTDLSGKVRQVCDLIFKSNGLLFAEDDYVW